VRGIAGREGNAVSLVGRVKAQYSLLFRSVRKYFGFISDNASNISQYELSDNDKDGAIEFLLVRQMYNGIGNTEGMVADDETATLYAANESSGIYKFEAEPDSSNLGTLVAPTGVNGLTADVEGVTIYYASNGEGYLIASSQGSNNFKVYERKVPHTFIKTIELTDVSATDGIDVTNVSLGSLFPFGLFLTHDGTGSPYTIKGSKWEDLELDVDTTYWDPRTSPFVYTQNTFAVIGDFGSAGDIEMQWVADMVKSWNPEYVITTGDNSYDSTPIDNNIGQFYSKFIFPYSGTYLPSSPDKNRFWVSVGNHDYTDGGGITAQKEYFPYLVPNTYYDIVIGDVHFFMLDSDHFSSYSGAQKTWFDSVVTNSDSKWKIATFHHPPYTSGTHGPNSDTRNWPFNENDFDLVFNGHNHNMEHLTIDGQLVHYCVQGAGGRSLYSFPLDPTPATSVWQLSEYGACKVIVEQDNINVEFWSTDGSIRNLEHSFSLNGPLPVELSYFAGEFYKDKIKLRWQTETEVNNHGFSIERKKENSYWETIGFVDGNGNTNSPKNYYFTDSDVRSSTHYYYRLKQIDNDGTFEYSDIVSIDVFVPNVFELSQNYPNPFNPVTNIDFVIPEKQLVILRIYNTLGQLVSEVVNEQLDGGKHSINFNASELPSGTYIYSLITQQKVLTKKMTLLK